MPRPYFVTRKFPPSVGGMETLAAGTWQSILRVRPDAAKISWGGSNRALLWWFPSTVARLLADAVRRRIEFVLLGDALTYAVTTPLLRLFRIPHATMIMGLDVTYQNRLYRMVVRPLLRRAPRVIAISAATAQQTREIGVPADRISVLRLGVVSPEGGPDRVAAAISVRERLRLAPDDMVLLTVGRLVRRKGVRWFVAEVLPQLPANVHYIVVGDGVEAEPIARAAEKAGVGARTHLLGRVDDTVREELLRGADLFVQPNIPIEGDMEGFGLVVVEAAMRGTPVVAADLEGIKDAVANGRTGVLLPTGDAQAWSSHLAGALIDGGKLAEQGRDYREHALALFSEAAMGRALSEQLGWTAG